MNFSDKKNNNENEESLKLLLFSLFYFGYILVILYLFTFFHVNMQKITFENFICIPLTAIPFLVYLFYLLGNYEKIKSPKCILYPLILVDIYAGAFSVGLFAGNGIMIMLWILSFFAIPGLVVLFIIGLIQDLKNSKK